MPLKKWNQHQWMIVDVHQPLQTSHNWRIIINSALSTKPTLLNKQLDMLCLVGKLLLFPSHHPGSGVPLKPRAFRPGLKKGILGTGDRKLTMLRKLRRSCKIHHVGPYRIHTQSSPSLLFVRGTGVVFVGQGPIPLIWEAPDTVSTAATVPPATTYTHPTTYTHLHPSHHLHLHHYTHL